MVAELQATLGIGTAKINPQLSTSANISGKQLRISEPNVACNLVIKFLKPAKKIIIIEDFHYASHELKSGLSEDLKAFSDEKGQ
jgi:hypothetical protein